MGELRDEIEATTLLDSWDTENIKSLEEVTPISTHTNHSDRHVMIGTELTKELRDALVEFLKMNYDVFAWSQGEVSGIDPHVVIHKLFTNLDNPPILQKMRKFALEWLKVIEEEVLILINTNIIRESHYPNWLANIVVTPMNGEKWIVFVNFTDFNKACPKEYLPSQI